MSYLADIGFFVLLFFLLVFIHELGHYLMAKWMGIKVEKFSIGMGPSLFSFKGGETEYRLALLPLGGYVKMAGDDPSKEYTGEEKERGFLTQKPPAKLLVVFGGPVFNLLLPVIIFATLLAVGIPSMAPTVGSLQDDGAGAKAGLLVGDKVIRIDGEPIRKWTEFERVIQASSGKTLAVEVERLDPASLTWSEVRVEVTPQLGEGRTKFGEPIQTGRVGMSPEFVTPQIFFDTNDSIVAKSGLQRFDRVLSVNGEKVRSFEQLVKIFDHSREGAYTLQIDRNGERMEKVLNIPACGNLCSAEFIGLTPVTLVVGTVDPVNPAYKAGLRANDRLVSIAGERLRKWEDIARLVRSSEGKPVEVVWNRDGNEMSAVMTPEKTVIADPVLGKDNPNARDAVFRIGVGPAATIDTEYWIEQSANPLKWLSHGVKQTWELSSMTVEALWKLVTGQLSIKLLGSPIMIYKVAGNSYRIAGGGSMGWISFFSTLALLSITLGLVNLLPIPVLDGGHATFFLIEWIRGKPVSLKVMEVAMQVGLFALICVFALVLYNDFYRYGWLDPILNYFR